MAKYILKFKRTFGGVILTHYGNKGSKLTLLKRNESLPQHISDICGFDNESLHKINVTFDDLRKSDLLKVTSEKGLTLRCEINIDSPLSIQRRHTREQRKRIKELKALKPKDGYICNLQDLLDYFDAETPGSLNKRVYKSTDCGASISLYHPMAKPLHNGDAKLREIPNTYLLHGFTIQTIIEGSEQTIDSGLFELPVKISEMERFIEQMEDQASEIFDNIGIDDAAENPRRETI